MAPRTAPAETMRYPHELPPQRRQAVADLALDTFLEMGRAAAIVGTHGELRLVNDAFTELFGGVDGLTARLAKINADVAASGGRLIHEVTLPDGRTVGLEVTPLEQGCLITGFDISRRQQRRAREAQLARTDDLTQLGNRLLFQEQLAERLAEPGHAYPPALLTIDLGRFKALNETLGRKTGDALLRLVAKRICSALADDDVVARLEGDKFAVLQLGQPQPQAAAALAARLIDLLGRAYLVDGQLINISACVGIVVVTPDMIDDEQVMSSADLALSRAKSDGQGSYRFFEAAMDEKMRSCRKLEIDLRRALSLREFSLVYQPQVNLRSSAVSGFEALLRWQCPTRGAVSPLDFIPLAEQTGVITSIGEWVLRTACREAASWPNDHSIAVNVSGVQFAHPNLVKVVMSALAESGLAPQRLELEITESVMLDDQGQSLTVLNNLRSLGVRMALDDFGTGYSSLGYLRRFSFDKIKIDQSFVRGTAHDPAGQAIVRAISSLGQSLGMKTVAEGVETREQFDRVVADGCTDVQGYLISRPLPAGQIASFLDDGIPQL